MIRIVVEFVEEGFQWPLKDHYPVRALSEPGGELLFSVTGAFIANLLLLYYGQAGLQKQLLEQIPPRLPKAIPKLMTPAVKFPPRKALPRFVQYREERERLRKARKSAAGRR